MCICSICAVVDKVVYEYLQHAFFSGRINVRAECVLAELCLYSDFSSIYAVAIVIFVVSSSIKMAYFSPVI